MKKLVSLCMVMAFQLIALSLIAQNISFSAQMPEGLRAKKPDHTNVKVGSWPGCIPCAIPENEPDIPTDGVDVVNGGCNSTPRVYTDIAIGQTFCGRANQYSYYGLQYRDTDWYRLILTEPKTLYWSGIANFYITLFIIASPCESGPPIVTYLADVYPGTVGTIAAYLNPGEYWFWVGPSNWGDPYYYTGDYMVTLTETPPVEPWCNLGITVGAGGTYPNLTGVGGLFEDINSSVLTEDMEVTIISNLVEPGTVALNQWAEDGNGPYTLTIKPSAAVVRNITGNVALDMIRLEGADRVTFDGRYAGSGKYLLFRNQAGFNSTFTFKNDATNNTLRNCIIEGSNRVTSGGVVQLGAGTTTGNDNILITENLFRNFNTVNPNNMLSSNSTSTTINSDIVVTNNEFKNFRTSGIYVAGSGAGTAWTVENNAFYYDFATPNTLAQTVISFAPSVLSSNNVIKGNRIGGSDANNGGAPWVNSANLTFKGIFANAGTYTIEDNIITNILLSGSGAAHFTGIDLSVFQGVTSSVKNNIIGSVAAPNSITLAGTGNFTGIRVNSTLPVQRLEGNTIANITYTSAGLGSPLIKGIGANKAILTKNKIYGINCNGLSLTPTMYGIYLNGIAGVTNECTNNMISMGGGAVPNPLIYGIYEGSAANSKCYYYYNTVNIYGNASTTQKSVCYYRQNSVNVTLKNNLFSNFRAAGPGGQYAIYTASGTYWTYSNFNDLYTATTPLGNWAGANKATFALWKTASGKDLNSINFGPAYFTNDDLHLTAANTGIDGKGNPVVSYTQDIDGDLRNVTVPDIGCDEFVSAPPRLGGESTATSGALKVYPNPVSSDANLELYLEADQNVEISLYNLMGEKLEVISSGMMTRGTHQLTFTMDRFTGGMYFLRMTAGGSSVVQKVQLIR